jgi:probable HAF family extracellular repeat protein
MQDLGLLPGASLAMASDISADGAVVVGASGPRPFRWTAGGGMQSLGLLPGATSGWATGVSGDGLVVAGTMGTDSNRYMFRWTAAGGLVNLGALPDAAIGAGSDINADGSVIVGFSATEQGYRAVLWSASAGMIDLHAHLVSQGADLTGWVLSDARGVSADGRVIVGTGEHDGVNEAWVVRLPPPCPGDLDDDHQVGLADLAALLANFATDSGALYADGDLDEDGDVDLQDLASLLGRFGASCQ